MVDLVVRSVESQQQEMNVNISLISISSMFADSPNHPT